MKPTLFAVIVFLSGVTIGTGRLPAMGRTPKIISETASTFGPIISPSKELLSKTVHTLERAVAEVPTNTVVHADKFYATMDQLVEDIHAGGLPPGFLWKRFLAQSTVESKWNQPRLAAAPKGGHYSIKFQLGQYMRVVVWAEPYLARKAIDNPKLMTQYGEALIRLDMEDLFEGHWATGIASYTRRQMLSPKFRKWLLTHPPAWVIAHNQPLRNLFRYYYRNARKLNYYATTPTLKPMQALINRSDDRLPRADVIHVLEGITGLRALIGKEQYYNRWMLANLLWKFLCLAKARHNKPAVIQIETYIQSWKNRTKRWYLRRWLSEALTTPGKAPWRVWSPPIEVRLLHKP